MIIVYLAKDLYFLMIDIFLIKRIPDMRVETQIYLQTNMHMHTDTFILYFQPG